MKILVPLLTFVLIIIIAVIFYFTYQHSNQSQIVVSEPPVETPINTTEPLPVAKKILMSTVETDSLTAAERSAVEASIDSQLADNERLYQLAIKAGTTLSTSTRLQAWQRQVYNHTDEAGLAAYIASLGLDEVTYRTQIEKDLLGSIFVETKAAALITEKDILNYYNNLPPDGRAEFSLMETEIRETLITQAAANIRTQLLSTN